MNKIIRDTLLFYAVTAPNFVLAADDCTFDQANQVAIIKSVAKTVPGGKINLRDHLIVWNDQQDGRTSFTYGGCADLGSSITRDTAMPQARTQAQVFTLAGTLSHSFWDNKNVSAQSATQALQTALKKGTYSISNVDKKIIYNIADPSYVELSITHQYLNGIDHVTLVWQGNF